MAKGKASAPHIGIFGRRNNGKSSLLNALAGQEVSIVSEVAGTTTDPVKKTIEIGGLGPVVFIDTAGIDDIGGLGEKRIARTQEIIKSIDLAILIITRNTFGQFEKKLVSDFQHYEVPFFIVHNKSDLMAIYPETRRLIKTSYKTELIDACLTDQESHSGILALIRKLMPESAWKPTTLIGDLISYGDSVLLITPIDIEAPEGRLILPQVQVIRDILDNDGVAVICKEKELDTFFRSMSPKPKLVVTDSQVFLKADASIPRDIPLTSFSIILARQKGDFQNYLKGTPFISELKDGDKILVLESCSHHVSCDDIGRVKIPRWLNNFTGRKLEFVVVAGLNSIPGKITDYAMVIQCGGCMITRKQLINRLKPAVDAGIPVTNYGMAIAYAHGIYHRAVAPFTLLNPADDNYL